MHGHAEVEAVTLTAGYLRWIVLLPFLGTLFHVFFGRRVGRTVVNAVACGVLVGSFALALGAFVQLRAAAPGAKLLDHVYTWISAGGFSADAAFTIDALSGVMCLVVTGVGLLIHVYSTGYMAHEPDVARYFAYFESLHGGDVGADPGRQPPNMTLGLAWGTSISATVDAIEDTEPISIKVVQLVGAMGARNMEYDGHDLVSRITEKLGGEAYYLNAPYICQNADLAQSLLETKGVKETISVGKKTDIALLGIGTTSSNHSSFYLAGYVSSRELDDLRREGAVGDVCGLHFDIDGQPAGDDFSERLVTIQREDLLSIPFRLGVAGGVGKAHAILDRRRSILDGRRFDRHYGFFE